MLIRFTDDYDNYLYEARQLIGRVVAHIAEKEPFVGASKELDKFYALSTALHAIVDHLEYNDNLDPKYNEYLLLQLKELLTKDLCGTNSQIPEVVIDTMPDPVDLNALKRAFIPLSKLNSTKTPN